MQAGDCRAYITPAGGGVWSTKNALTGQPNWEYLGGPLGINAAGSVYVDPNDPSGQTVYAGTGEANICASGASPEPAYKSTNGGDTWTGPLGGNTLNGLGIGAIVVEPGSPNTIYALVTTALRGMSSVCCTGVTRPVPWGPGSGACTSRRTAARHGVSSTTARSTSPTVWATSPSGTTGGPARRAVSARRARPRTRRSCTRPRTPAVSGALPTAARPGCRSSRR